MKKVACTLALAAVVATSASSAVASGASASSAAASGASASSAAADSAVYAAATLKQLRQSIRAVERLPESEGMYWRSRKHGLNVANVMWEDTGRDAYSSAGPNISDVTLELREPTNAQGTRFRTHLLPVLRHPNYTDKTADVAADKLWVKVGNQSRGAQLVSVPLSEVLKNLREYVSNPDSIRGTGDLSAPRGSHMLVSAQHVFVPIPQQGKIEFTPVIYNYQSDASAPAVLTLLVTRQGTSVVAVTNSGADAGECGQRLYFNNKGQKTTLSAERTSDVQARVDAAVEAAAGGTVELDEQDVGALDDGADMMMIVQVPLRVPSYGRHGYGSGMGTGSMPMPKPMSSAPMKMALGDALAGSGGGGRAWESSRRSDVEAAVLGHGKDLGEVAEGRRYRLVRDSRFPVRVTVQFYKATSNGVISDADLVAAKAEIDKVYAKGDYVGSLVVAEGARHRPTDWHLGHTQPVAIIKKLHTLPTAPSLDDVAEKEPGVAVVGAAAAGEAEAQVDTSASGTNEYRALCGHAVAHRDASLGTRFWRFVSSLLS